MWLSRKRWPLAPAHLFSLLTHDSGAHCRGSYVHLRDTPPHAYALTLLPAKSRPWPSLALGREILVLQLTLQRMDCEKRPCRSPRRQNFLGFLVSSDLEERVHLCWPHGLFMVWGRAEQEEKQSIGFKMQGLGRKLLLPGSKGGTAGFPRKHGRARTLVKIFRE